MIGTIERVDTADNWDLATFRLPDGNESGLRVVDVRTENKGVLRRGDSWELTIDPKARLVTVGAKIVPIPIPPEPAAPPPAPEPPATRATDPEIAPPPEPAA